MVITKQAAVLDRAAQVQPEQAQHRAILDPPRPADRTGDGGRSRRSRPRHRCAARSASPADAATPPHRRLGAAMALDVVTGARDRQVVRQHQGERLEHERGAHRRIRRASLPRRPGARPRAPSDGQSPFGDLDVLCLVAREFPRRSDELARHPVAALPGAFTGPGRKKPPILVSPFGD